jgi:hypothetical protein
MLTPLDFEAKFNIFQKPNKLLCIGLLHRTDLEYKLNGQEI